jgi:hypothetical protein
VVQVHDVCAKFGFYPGFRGVQAVSRLFDIVTPGASATLISNDNQILQVLEMTKKALRDLVSAWCACTFKPAFKLSTTRRF